MLHILSRRLFAVMIAIVWVIAPVPAWAAITITFWSHELGNSFPHAFFTLRGVADAGGAPVNVNYGFTARTLSPKLLFATVRGKLDIARPGYMAGSDAQFSVVLTDAQYADILKLVSAWSEAGDSRYDLKTRNCVHFVQEAARRSGLTGLDHPDLMKRPRSFLKAIAAGNTGKIIVLGIKGRDYLATLPPLPTTSAASAP